MRKFIFILLLVVSTFANAQGKCPSYGKLSDEMGKSPYRDGYYTQAMMLFLHAADGKDLSYYSDDLGLVSAVCVGVYKDSDINRALCMAGSHDALLDRSKAVKCWGANRK